MSKQKTPDTATLNFWIAQIEHRTVPIERWERETGQQAERLERVEVSAHA